MSTHPDPGPPERQRRADERRRERDVADILERVRRLLERLAALQQGALISLPLILPTAFAAVVDAQSRASGIDVPHIYLFYVMHGAWHSAMEHGEREMARQVATIIAQYAPAEEWRGSWRCTPTRRPDHDHTPALPQCLFRRGRPRPGSPCRWLHHGRIRGVRSLLPARAGAPLAGGASV